MKSLFLAALAAFAFFSSAPVNAQQYRDSYHRDSHSGAAHVLGALIEIAAHNDRRPNYYGGNGYGRDRHYDRYNYTPRYRNYRHQNHYNSYRAYRPRNNYRGHNSYRGRHHGRRD